MSFHCSEQYAITLLMKIIKGRTDESVQVDYGAWYGTEGTTASTVEEECNE